MVRLVSADLRLLDAALAGDDALAEAVGCGVVSGWATFEGALEWTRDAVAADPQAPAWGSRFFIAGDPPELVGWGGFKGPPSEHGIVELGYEVAESRRGRGLASAATQAMVDEAFADDGVTTVIAHTLPERNASTRVLEKCGFGHDGQTTERGQTVWRWRLERQGATG